MTEKIKREDLPTEEEAKKLPPVDIKLWNMVATISEVPETPAVQSDANKSITQSS